MTNKQSFGARQHRPAVLETTIAESWRRWSATLP